MYFSLLQSTAYEGASGWFPSSLSQMDCRLIWMFTQKVSCFFPSLTLMTALVEPLCDLFLHADLTGHYCG